MNLSTRNTIPGTARQSIRSASGELVQRAYVYLAPAVWEALYAASARSGVSASKYLASLIAIPAADGPDKTKDNNESTRSRNI